MSDQAVPAVRLVAAAITTTTACVVPVFLVGGLAVQIGAELDFTPAGLGLAVAIYFAVSAVTSIPAGALVERHGPALIARAGIILAAAGLLAIALGARTYPLLVLLLAAGAGANSLGQLSANAWLARAPTRHLGLSFGFKQAAIPAATLLAGASVPLLGLTIGWRWAFGLAAATAASALLLVPSDRRVPRHAAAAGPPPGRVQVVGPGRPGRRGERATGALVVVGMAVALGAASAGSLGTFLVDSSVTRGLAPGLAGLALTLGSIACIAGRLAAGALADRRSGHGDLTLVAVQLVIGAAGLALLAVPGQAALAAGVLLGFGFGWAFPGLVNFAVVQLHPHAPASATSITQTGVYAGGCVGPIAFGSVAATAGYPTAWLGAGVAMLIATGLILLARRLLREHRARSLAGSLAR